MLLSAATGFADVTPPTASQVVDRGDRISLSQPILFVTGKAEIDPRSHAELDELAALLNRVSSIILVDIGVHSDARGMDAYNLRMAQARAEAIRNYLAGRGVNDHRLRAKGYGETQPLCKDPTPACFARNRRVELRVVARQRTTERPHGAPKRSQ